MPRIRTKSVDDLRAQRDRIRSAINESWERNGRTRNAAARSRRYNSLNRRAMLIDSRYNEYTNNIERQWEPRVVRVDLLNRTVTGGPWQTHPERQYPRSVYAPYISASKGSTAG